MVRELGAKMPAVMIRMDLRRLHEILQDASGREHFASRYPDLISWYDENVSKGIQDSLVQASLSAMWQQEMDRDAESFCRRLGSASTE